MGRSRTNSLRSALVTLSMLTAMVVAGMALIQQQKKDEIPVSDLPPSATGDTITVASFNIQTFGHTKLQNPGVLEVLAGTVRRFDVVAIQEIRDIHTDVLPKFVDVINESGQRYDYLLGPALGRSHSKERYAFVYNTSRVQPDRDWVYTVDDPDDLFHREPLVARFQTRKAQPFTFTLVNIHTDPDEAEQEVNALADVLAGLQQDESREDDVIVLGDLNADPRHFGRLARVPQIKWVIDGIPTNTRRTKTYDNVLFDEFMTAEFTGRAGVFDFAREFQLSPDAALAVSDHLPVWAEFRSEEQQDVARNPSDNSLR